MAVIFALLLGLQTPGQEARIRDLIEHLRADKPEERDRAARELVDQGVPALPLLERASEDADPDLSGRARRLIRKIGIRTKLTPNLLKVVPGIDERLLIATELGWTEVFLELMPLVKLSENPLDEHPPPLQPDDLRGLIAPALRGTRDSISRHLVIQSIHSLKPRSAIPDLVPLLENDDAEHQLGALEILARLRAPEAISAALRLLQHEDSTVRCRALRGLFPPRSDEMVRGILRLLKDPSSDVRADAAMALATVEAREAVPQLLELLKDRWGEVRKHSLQALWTLKAPELLPALPRLLDDLWGPTRITALQASASLQGRAAVPALLRALEDANDGVNLSALKELAELDARESAPALIKLLTTAEDQAFRRVIADTLCQWGIPDGVPLFLESSFLYFRLNPLRAPESWARITKRKYAGGEVGPRIRFVEWIAREEGLTLDPPQDGNGNVPDWFLEKDWSRNYGETSLEVLSTLLFDRGWEFILEPGKMRIVTRNEAEDFWKLWWQREQQKKR